MEQEQLNTNQQVVGSNPTVSSKYSCIGRLSAKAGSL